MWLTEAADRSNDQRADSSATFAGDASRNKLLSLVFVAQFFPQTICIVRCVTLFVLKSYRIDGHLVRRVDMRRRSQNGLRPGGSPGRTPVC